MSWLNRISRSLGVATIVAGLSLSAAAQQRAQVPEQPARPGKSVPQVQVREFALEALGVTVTEQKIVDPATGDVTGAAWDQNGATADVPALLLAERAARHLNPVMKIQPALRDALGVAPGDLHPVILWLDFDAEALDKRLAEMRAGFDESLGRDGAKALEAEATKFVMERNRMATAPVVAELRTLGAPVRYVSTCAPAIFLDADQALVLDLASLPAVDTIYLETSDRQDHNSSANSTHRTSTPYALGWRGAGIDVAMLENNGIDPACPHLVVSGWFNAASPNPDNHIHGTSGCVASRLSTRRGASPDVNLYSANASSYGDAAVTAAGDWCAANDRDVTNMSFGGNYGGALQYLDRYFDYKSRFYLDSFVASAGNDGTSVGSPGTAWNVITAGSFNDFDTSSWTGDAMSSFSSWQNPASGCEKPNLAAVGELVDTLGQGPGWLTNDYSGTSFSAPFVSGNLAIAMGRDVSAILSPEAAMAMMMATAWHNVEGATRLSSVDGAGGLNGRAAAYCANADRVRYLSVTPSSFTSTGYRTYNINLNAGDRARVCIAWAANANASYTTTVLNADLDISVFAGANVISGTSLGSSASFNNNFEIVEFTPATTGTYTIRINDYRFDGASETIGIAWSQRTLDAGT